MDKSTQRIGIPYFTAEQWKEAQTYMADADGMRMTHSDFEQRVQKVEREMQAQGVQTLRVPIERQTFTQWCATHNCQVNADGRSLYAAWVAQENALN